MRADRDERRTHVRICVERGLNGSAQGNEGEAKVIQAASAGPGVMHPPPAATENQPIG